MTRIAFAGKVLTLTLLVLFATSILLSAGEKRSEHHHYKLIDLGTFGGPTTFISPGLTPLNSRGLVTSCADTSVLNPNSPNINAIWGDDPYITHAFSWENGNLNDLGTLPGGTNSCGQAINRRGQIIGFSENGENDPLLGAPAVHAALWDQGQITDLGTFGGYESVSYSMNDRGMAVGAASNTIPDPYTANYGNFFIQAATQVHGFLWKHGTLQDLGTLGTGTDSVAFYVNNHGQVAGQSFTDTTVNAATGLPTMHPFLWENGVMKDLGTLGGTLLQYFAALNDKGQAAGVMNVAGDATYHPFLWDGTTLQDLGTFGGSNGWAWDLNDAGEVVGSALDADGTQRPFLWSHGHLMDIGTLKGDFAGIAKVINNRGQISGLSFSHHATHVFLRETDGSMFNLQRLIVGGSQLTLAEPVFIGADGEVVVNANTSNGDNHVVLLIPCDENHPGLEGCDYNAVDVSSTAQAAPARSARSALPAAHNSNTPFWHRAPHLPFNSTGRPDR